MQAKQKAVDIHRRPFQPGRHAGWLGRGIYFFENNMSLALRFIDKDVNPSSRAIISAKISVTTGKVLDITQVGSMGLEEFHKHREHFINKVGAENVRVRTNREHLDSVIVDDLCRRREYYLVRAQTYTYSTEDKRYGLSSRFPNGIELCVKNASIITDKRLIDFEYAI